MNKLISFLISLISFTFIVLSIIFLRSTKYTTIVIVLSASLEYILLTLLNLKYNFNKDYKKYNLEIIFIQVIGSCLTLYLLYITRTIGFNIFCLIGLVWIVFLEIQDVKVKRINLVRD